MLVDETFSGEFRRIKDSDLLSGGSTAPLHPSFLSGFASSHSSAQEHAQWIEL